MKNLKTTIGVLTIVLFSLTSVACTGNKKADVKMDATEINHDNNDGHDHNHHASSNKKEMSHGDMTTIKSSKSNLIVASYLQLKNALVADDADEAAVAAKVMIKAFKGFDMSEFSQEQQKEIKEIIEDASEQVEHISENADKIDHQREHFEVLSTDVADLLAIVGTEKTLYITYCPMVKSSWLSETKEIKNPFYGKKMMTCGSVKSQIN